MDFRILLLFSWCIMIDFTCGQTEDNCGIRFSFGSGSIYSVYKQCGSEVSPNPPCRSSSERIVVTSIYFFQPNECVAPGNEGGYHVNETEDMLTWKIMRAACNGLPTCHKPDSTLMDKKCNRNPVPVKNIDVRYSCKPVEPDDNTVWDMAKDFKNLFTTPPESLYLVLNATEQSGSTHRRCEMYGYNTEVEVKLLYGDLGSGENCGRIHVFSNVTRDPLLNEDCNSLSTSYTPLFETSQGNQLITMDVEMSVGFLWLEITGTQSLTINCQNGEGKFPTTVPPRTDGTSSTAAAAAAATTTTDNGTGLPSNVIIAIIIAVSVVVVVFIISVALYCWKRKARGHDPEKSNAAYGNGDDAKTEDHSSVSLLPKNQGNHGGNSTPAQTTANNVDLGDYMEIPDTALSTPGNPPQNSKPMHSSGQTKAHSNPAGIEMYSTVTEPQYSETSSGRSNNASALPSTSKPNMDNGLMSLQPDVIGATYSVVDKKNAKPIQAVSPQGIGIYSVSNLITAHPETATATYHTLDSLTGEYAHLKRPGDEQQIIDNVYDG